MSDSVFFPPTHSTPPPKKKKKFECVSVSIQIKDIFVINLRTHQKKKKERKEAEEKERNSIRNRRKKGISC